MEIPRTLAEWDIGVIETLLKHGYYESEWFDFKERLPDSRDVPGKDRLATVCAAFANSAGGFLVFGVTDSRDRSVAERLVGVPLTVDLPEHFGVYAQKPQPGVWWSFKNPPLALDSTHFIHVVHIPHSWAAPHAIIYGDGRMTFPKRTSKGVEYMNIEEVRMMFLGYYEKRIKLQLLVAELEKIANDADALMAIPDDSQGTRHSLANFEMDVLETILADTYTILVRAPAIISLLFQLRSACRNVNTKLRIFYGTVGLPLNGKEQIVRSHNEYLRQNCPPIASGARRTIDLLRTTWLADL